MSIESVKQQIIVGLDYKSVVEHLRLILISFNPSIPVSEGIYSDDNLLMALSGSIVPAH